MNKTKFLQTTILTVFISLFLVSCGASLYTGIRQVQLGMSKADVTSKLGDYYEVVSMVQVEQGNLEVLRYINQVAEDGKIVTKGYYVLHFLNGKLVELHQEDANPPVIYPPYPRPHNRN